MASLRKDLRDKLEKTVLAARVAAEAGALEALTALGVDQGKAFEHLKLADKALRNQLRARGRQVGDILDDRSGRQTLDHLVQVAAYEHWHRMLFARFLAENGLLLEPDNQVAVSLADVDELARDAKVDIWELAGRFAQRMLPAVFRADDPVLALTLARENRTKLEKMVAELPQEVFLADDSLGWTYQFWQTHRKNEVNLSGVKIGADELSPVTQLFTEDYMVDFLLHNTLGAWWAGKSGPIEAATEQEARDHVTLPAKGGLPALSWTFLRLVKDETTQAWVPAAGAFLGWPRDAKRITFLDPCMGSGHFIVFALPILARLRMEEESLDCIGAVNGVLRDNIHGLELDERCTQIGAFNLAITAWKITGYQPLPTLHLACSGLAPHATEAEWVALAGNEQKLRGGMERLYRLFQKASVLGSLISPRASEDTLLEAPYQDLQPLLQKAMSRETKDETAYEMTVTAWGVAKAAEILAGRFTLVATNVPYLGRGKQDDYLQDYCERNYPKAKADLATCFVERILKFCQPSGTSALITPQNWWSLKSYNDLRVFLLRDYSFELLATLGEEAWQSFGDRGPVASMQLVTAVEPEGSKKISALDALPKKTVAAKINELASGNILSLRQTALLSNPDSRIVFAEIDSAKLLSRHAKPHVGFQNGDTPRYVRKFWELPKVAESAWRFLQMPPSLTSFAVGLDSLLSSDFETGNVDEANCRRQSGDAFGSLGVLVKNMRDLSATRFWGGYFDQSSTAICCSIENLAALWCFIESPEFQKYVRQVESKVNVTPASFGKITFDLERWKTVAAEKYPFGLPEPFSSDPTQWLFNGHPRGSDQPLHVATARLLGYLWPRQTGSSFPNCAALGPDDIASYVDTDGIVCLSAVRGERTAADRLRAVLSAALATYDEHALIAATGSKATSLENWLRDDFFAQHCALFDARPFLWHIWDGRIDGFHAVINYHSLSSPGGAGRKRLETLTFGYLGDWIRKQQDDSKRKEPGAEDRLVAAQELQLELKAILAGEPPYDIFVRWKPLNAQPIGWDPDPNDGIRLNIRPFLNAKDVARKDAGIFRARPGSSLNWAKDRGKEPVRDNTDFPWFWCWDEVSVNFTGGTDFDGNRWNHCHYTTQHKIAHKQTS